MDHAAFDDLTRVMAGGVPHRRAALRFLAGGALASLLVRLGLDESADAKTKRAKRHDDKKQSDELHATGKKHKKHKDNKHKDKKKPHEPPPPLPPGCQNCGDCEMCQDGACVPDPDLERVFCAVSESMCSYCQHGACTPFQEACDDGTCPRKGYCCQGEKFCPSIESPTGFFCIKGDGCCEGKKKCGDQCIPLLSCCDEEPHPACDSCSEEVCDHGSWVCQHKGVQCQEGCCPVGYYCHHLGSCCINEPTLFCTCPSGYHSEAGLCVPD